MKIQYTGTSHIRTISAAQFALEGLEGVSELKTVRGGIVEVADEVADFLLVHEPTQWKRVPQVQAAQLPLDVDVDAPVAPRAKKLSTPS